VQVGDTVSLRVVTADGPTDVVGVLLAATAERLTVRRRDGVVTEITADSVRHSRVVPPGPARRIDVADLERVAAAGWRALETEALGDWLLRASGGVTSRANSALPLGDPGRALPDAVAAVERWYAARGLPPRVQLPEDAGWDDLRATLADAGWTPVIRVHVMTAELGPVLRALPEPPAGVRLDDNVDDTWFAAWRADGEAAHTDAGRQLLVNHPLAGFVSIRDGDRCVAVARTCVDGRWAGLFAVEVAPTHRRRGLATAVTAAGLRWAVGKGARHGYLQVAADNAAAISLYADLGFEPHHDYVHWVQPPTSVEGDDL
jgi:RimJ/RimL family protein N-acetyltransferase